MQKIVVVIAILLALVPIVAAKPLEINVTEIYRATGGGCCPTDTVNFSVTKTFNEVAFAAWIVHHHSCGNSLAFKVLLSDGSPTYETSWSLCLVGSAVPINGSRSLNDTPGDGVSYNGYIGSRSPGFAWLEFRIKPVIIRKTLDREDDVTDLGNVSEITDASPKSNYFRVSTPTSGVAVWVGTEDDIGTRETSDRDAHVFACGDTNENKICDVNEAVYQQCENAGGDWYRGICCGTNVTTCAYVQQYQTGTVSVCVAWGNPPRGSTIAPCIRYENQPVYVNLSAICGNNSEGDWEWIPADDIGEIHPMVCPDASVVPNGTGFYSCGDQLGNSTFLFGDFRNVTFAGFTHEYSCDDKFVEECTGQDAAFSPINWLPTGAVGSRPGTWYCASDGDWTTDLDIKDNTSCMLAGFSWTGSKCCSEADDDEEYYNDDSPGALGGCWNKAFIESGEFSVEDRVLNFNGSFNGCRITESDLLSLKDFHTSGWLINNSLRFCGAVLYDAQPGGLPHAVCHPDGIWRFTDAPGGTIEKSIAWPGLVNLTRLNQTGCCAYEQCWNGTRCQPLDAFYRIGDFGFECKLPPPPLPPAQPIMCVPKTCVMSNCTARLSAECAAANCIPISCFSSMMNELCTTPGCAPATSGRTPGPAPIGSGAMCTVYPDGSIACVA